MDLPLVDEIREARRLAEDATDATMQLIGIGVALQAIAMIEAQLARTPDPGVPVPADDLVDDLAERWPSLADLPAVMPPPHAPYLTRLQARRTQLDSARQVLKPIAENQSAQANRLARLQHEQQHALAAPQFAAEVATLVEASTARERLARDLQPMNRLVTLVTPTIGVLAGFENRLEQALAESRGDDPEGRNAWRATHVAHGLLQGLAATMNQLDLGIRIPSLAAPPSNPDSVGPEELRERVSDAIAGVRSLREDMEREVARVQRESAALTDRYDRLTRQIVDRMG